MDRGAPSGIRWEDQGAECLDALVDYDIGYLDVQHAVEVFVQHRLLDKMSTSFELDSHTVYLHRYPRQDLKDLYVFWTREDDLIRMIHVCFAH